MQCIFCYAETWNNVCPVCKQRALHQKEKSALKRHHRQRVIRRRTNIIRYSWRLPNSSYFCAGRMDKHNLSCNCWMCKGEKKAGIEKPKYRLIREIEADY